MQRASLACQRRPALGVRANIVADRPAGGGSRGVGSSPLPAAAVPLTPSSPLMSRPGNGASRGVLFATVVPAASSASSNPAAGRPAGGSSRDSPFSPSTDGPASSLTGPLSVPNRPAGGGSGRGDVFGGGNGGDGSGGSGGSGGEGSGGDGGSGSRDNAALNMAKLLGGWALACTVAYYGHNTFFTPAPAMAAARTTAA